jgi:hypothetical protein
MCAVAQNGVNLAQMQSALSRSSFASDPLTDIQRAIVDSCPFGFVDREKLYGFTVDRADVFEIENQSTAFLFQQGPQRVHVVPCNPPTDAKEHTTVSDCLAMDSAGHSERPSGAVARSVISSAIR